MPERPAPTRRTPVDAVSNLTVRTLNAAARGELVALRREVDSRPGELDPRLLLAQTLVQCGAFKPAIEQLRICREHASAPEMLAGIFFNQGSCHQELKRYAEAIDCYEQAIFLMPDMVWAHLLMGICLGQAGERARAIDCLQRAVALNGREPRARLELADLLRQEGQLSAARREYEVLLDLQPHHAHGRLAHYELHTMLQ